MEFVMVSLILLIGACLQGLVGFGLGLFSAPLLFILAPQYVPGPMILNALLLTLLISLRSYQALQWRLTGFAIGGGTMGVLMAAVVLTSLSFEHYRAIFGMIILLSVLISVTGIRPKINAFNNLVVGILSGFMGTVTSAGGAPIGLLYQYAEAKLRNAQLNVFFLYINLFGIVVLWYSGLSGWHDVLLFLQSIPALLLGWWLSAYVGRSINTHNLRRLILLVAFSSGLMLVLL